MFEESFSQVNAGSVRDLRRRTHQNLTASEAIVPCLTITIHRSLTINLDILATPDHESDALLEGVVEVVVLPILNIVGELEILCQTRSPKSSFLRLPSVYHQA